MNRTVSLLVIWNVALSLLLGWSFLRKGGGTTTAEVEVSDGDTTATNVFVPLPKDSAALANARIAFFSMDSVQQQFDLVRESASQVENEGRRLESNLMNEMKKAKARYAELMAKDHTYSTQAELQADEKELHELEMRIQQSQAEGQEQIDRMQVRMLQRITTEIQDFLTDYNGQARFDYIFSIQDGGQIWVGNHGLDITNDVVGGLNSRHRAKKEGGAK